MGYASGSFSMHDIDAKPSQWSLDFRKLLSKTDTTSHRITSLLALLSSSISYGQPLPPYLDMPQPFRLVKHLDSIDPDLLSVRHIAEPEYSAFAVVQVCARAIQKDIEDLKK
jgi:hypothetical protein